MSVVTFAEKHPVVVEFLALFAVVVAVNQYHHVLSWVEGLEQIKASEALGG
jgi:ribosome-associated toxin RatA of RatAB toxin-antitoxin module